MIAIDTEFFKHYGRLHRPGGIFACLTQSGVKGKKLLEDKDEVKDFLKTLDGKPVALQNALYDIRQLRHHGLVSSTWKPQVFDTMLVEQDLFGGWYSQFGLAHLVRRWLHKRLPKDVRETFGTADILTPEQKQYARLDALRTRKVADKQITYIEDELGGDFSWYYDIDLPAMWAILDMQPIRIDVDAWLANADALEEEGYAIQDSLGFNVKSREQVRDALRSTGLRLRDKQSCDAERLEGWLEDAKLSDNSKRVALLEQVMRARRCRDAPSKYGRKWIELHVEDGQWVWPGWKTTGAKTGRMACGDPNMQQIPVRDMPIYRSFFLASPGGRLLISDVTQQEPWFSACLSHDQTLLEELNNDIDLHVRAADLFDIRGRQRRDKGKGINLGLNYGMSAAGLASRVGIGLDEAEAGLRARRGHYRSLYAWQNRMERGAERNGFVTTASGRRAWVNTHNYQWRRNAINGPVQGSAADQTKLALVYIHEQCRSLRLPFMVNLVVHDEIVVDVPKGMMKQYRHIVEDAWKEAGHKLMPAMKTEVKMASGHTWLAGKD